MAGSWAGKRRSTCLLKPDNMTVVVTVKRHFLAEFKIYKDIIVWVGRFFSIKVIPRLPPLFIILKRKMKDFGEYRYFHFFTTHLFSCPFVSKY